MGSNDHKHPSLWALNGRARTQLQMLAAFRPYLSLWPLGSQLAPGREDTYRESQGDRAWKPPRISDC